MFDCFTLFAVLLLGSKWLRVIGTLLLITVAVVLAYYSVWFAMFMAVCALIGWFSVDPEQYRNTAAPKYADTDVFGD